jgi:mono/diheme cytochrome c family protein
MSLRRALLILLAVLAPFLLLALSIGAVLFLRQGGFEPYRIPADIVATPAATPERLAHGEYVARLGNCIGCHTTHGGVPFTGGLAFRTHWGTIHSTNLTPDPGTGLGDWSLAEFRHAMRHGVSRNGVLYPAFPYAHFALAPDADVDALFVYLQGLPATRREPIPNRLDFPASWRPILIGWRMLHYRPARIEVGADRSAEWRRGRYLVDGLGHCAMCHGTRGALGSLPPQGYLGGDNIPGLGWYAPPLDAAQLERYSKRELADYLRAGNSVHGAAYGPMAEVVYNSLRYATDADALAIATFLKSVPPHAPLPVVPAAQRGGTGNGAALYEKHCADCHGEEGRGDGHAFPPLVDSVAVTAPDAGNAVRLILYGAIAPVTPLNPRPYSMPPFAQELSSQEIAEVANYIRTTFGQRRASVTASEVDALHGIMID